MSCFDAVAAQFNRHRALPDRAAMAVRAAVLAALKPRPRLLDLGAGSGRIGWPFVQARDDYVGVDLSFGMLRTFQARDGAARLVQADGCALPFGAATFDGVLMVQIFGGLECWRPLIDEALRVLRPDGALLLGRTRTPDGGIDARMKRQLDTILSAHDRRIEKHNTRADAERCLQDMATAHTDIEAARWDVTRTPRDFLDRHAGGAEFSKLPQSLRGRALRKLSDWALGQFGSLDARFNETHRFELRTFTFAKG